MIRATALFAFATMLACMASVVRAQDASGEIEKAVTALEAQWTQAQKSSDADTVGKLLADSFLNTDIDGKTGNKAQELADTKATHFSFIETKDVHVTVFGTTAIVSLVFIGKGMAPNGKPLTEHSRWTDTWVKMPDGSWQCVAAHGSEIKKKT